MLYFARLLVISMFQLVIGSQLSTLVCPTAWESHGLKCYKMSHQVSNFLNAKNYCHDQNAEVIMPKTVEENRIVKKLLDQ
ncbi:C-type lectin domain family 10 member A-like isoform X3 [Mytilus californianus]|nr:C-type lectin domain family 10 member A-like isoform X3 [Mytilus californianus]